MSPTDQWLPSEAAAEALHLSVSSLQAHKRSGLLEAGTHYYAVGTGLSGGLVWDVAAVRAALLTNTKRLAAKNKGADPKTVETYEEAF